jgi:hypothetical protein
MGATGSTVKSREVLRAKISDRSTLASRLVVNAGGTIPSFANVAALAAFPSASQPFGQLAFVQTVQAYWTYTPGATETPDGITIINALGGGQWIRLIEPSLFWQEQVRWDVDPVTGNDENNGISPATPLKTAAEYTRRTGTGDNRVVFGQVDVFIHNSLPATDQLLFAAHFQSQSSVLNFHGVPAVAHSGTLSGFDQYNQVAGTATQIHDAAALDFTPFVGQQVLITSGAAAGSRGNILKAVSAGIARLDWLTQPTAGNIVNPTFIAPSPGDTYEILTLPVAPNFAQDTTGFSSDNALNVAQAFVELLDFGDAVPPDGIASSTLPISIYYCRFPGVTEAEGSSYFGCLFTGGGFSPLITSALTVCGVLNSFILSGSGNGVLCYGVVLQNSNIAIQENGFVEAHTLDLGIGIFDSDSVITTGEPETGYFFIEGILWGSNNTTFIFSLTAGSQVILSNSFATTLAVTGGGGGYHDVIINGHTTLPAFDPSTGLFTAPVALSFANIKATIAAGGFNGNVWDPGNPVTGFFCPNGALTTSLLTSNGNGSAGAVTQAEATTEPTSNPTAAAIEFVGAAGGANPGARINRGPLGTITTMAPA